MQTIIHAKDYLSEKQDVAEDASHEPTPAGDDLAVRLFGTSPDYTQKEFEALWQTVINADDDEMIKFCNEKGVDVLDDNGYPVSGWRDVAVMLKAIEAGIVSLA